MRHGESAATTVALAGRVANRAVVYPSCLGGVPRDAARSPILGGQDPRAATASLNSCIRCGKQRFTVWAVGCPRPLVVDPRAAQTVMPGTFPTAAARNSHTMSALFRLLGVLICCYVARALVTGTVYAKSGMWGRSFRRDEDTLRYWSAVGAYGGLAVMLLFLF